MDYKSRLEEERRKILESYAGIKTVEDFYKTMADIYNKISLKTKPQSKLEQEEVISIEGACGNC